MKTQLLPFLRDPVCGDAPRLEIDVSHGDEVLSGALHFKSGKCAPIVDGIPRFSPEAYSGSFGIQWQRFTDTQVDSLSGSNRSQMRFEREVLSRIGSLEGSVVVDVGCGTGRFAEVALEHGATVIGVDLSNAVEAAYRNLGTHPRFHVLQADARLLPLDLSKVTGLYSIGVLQHTPNPYATAAAVVSSLAPGTWFAFTAYGRGRWTHFNGKYLVRPVTKRLPADRLLAALRQIVPVVEPILRHLPEKGGMAKAARFAVPVAVYPDFIYPSEEARIEESVLDTLDMLSPAFDHPLDAQRLERLLASYASQVTLHSERPVEVSGWV